MSNILDYLDRWFTESAFKFCSWLVTPEGYLWLILVVAVIGGILALILARRRTSYRF